jgi:hypothetical protein
LTGGNLEGGGGNAMKTFTVQGNEDNMTTLEWRPKRTYNAV